MCDQCGPTRGDGDLSRRRLLQVGALGLGSALLPATAGAHPPAAPGGGPPGRRVLLRGGTVLTLDDTVGDFVRGDVLVEDGRIRAVGPNLRAPGAAAIDCTGKIVTPGFVDTHRHMWQALFRNSGPDTLLLDYVEDVLQGFNLNLTPEEVYLGDLIAALSALNAGVTTILDWSHINLTPQHSDAVIQALRDSGIRAVYGYGPVFYHPNPARDPYPRDIFRLRNRYFSSEDQLLTLAMATRGSFGSVPQAVSEWKVAREVGARITTHIGVGAGGPGYLKQIADALAAASVRGLGDDTTYVHACTLTDVELAMIAASGGSLSLAVPVELSMGHGMPPIQRGLDHGIRMSLSVDVETNTPTDMFTQMRAAFGLQRGLKNEEHLFRIPDPGLDEHRAKLLTARDVLKLATIGGAEANGLGSRTGTLTPGKRADLLLLDATALNVAPVSNATGAVVLGMDTSNVDSVMVDGRFVKRDGRLVGVNVDRLLAQAQNLHDAVMRRNGRPSLTT
ncbi:amidohydrolase family protein [Solirubrobacter sp. CPCC 204708]|uniref:Amidohydrolase family protein n=1 Tax=Solirubrobacter deserti TaxID=2282478 RepID=A0ABT4RQY5_9ACTN|nr:amidohydrolase family protein [Solirubrobacter deserti]MBE2320641.1 amidohydrolase family protein [Solirubrobacter deserti]MDA0140695.1 amidohydrolase family protein [Solirubrobacter deserti]